LIEFGLLVLEKKIFCLNFQCIIFTLLLLSPLGEGLSSSNFNPLYPVMTGIHIYSNEGPDLQRGDNHKNIRIGWGHFKIFFSRTTGPILTRLRRNHHWVEDRQIDAGQRAIRKAHLSLQLR
jgi:hypothetical protein